jgi:E3 ubiquitin-protein ligase HECTD2
MRSPHIDWAEVSEWYMAVINAAESWRRVLGEVRAEMPIGDLSQEQLQELEAQLLAGQQHTQRVLLKMTEVLLKRPGRLLSDPSDIRFLLVVLHNPLLHPGPRLFHGYLQPNAKARVNTHNRQVSDTSVFRSSGTPSGHHSGIIKRILGLISNASPDCHAHLVAWLARLDVGHFKQINDLVGGFLTYRLLRTNEGVREAKVDLTAGLVPRFIARGSRAALHSALGASPQPPTTPASSSASSQVSTSKKLVHSNDWQIKAASVVAGLLFAANNLPATREARTITSGRGHFVTTSDFYSSVVDRIDLVADFEAWEAMRGKFAFCQYPFLLSISAKIKILEHEARRQMLSKARDALFDSIMTRKNVNRFLVLDVRRECLVDDSLKAVSAIVGSGSEDIQKRLRIVFAGEEGVDHGGLRKEWFLLLVREFFNADHGLFIYDEDSRYCYFNPNSFETSDQFFLVGVVMGLAIYNSTILDVPLPPFAFRKLLAAGPTPSPTSAAHPRPVMTYSLDDLAEFRPALVRGLRQLLEYNGDVEEAFALNFAIDTDRYGTAVSVPLCPKGEGKVVTNANRREFVDLYTRYLLDTSVSRQFEPFKRGFYTVCSGNALSLFRPEEIELLVRGSDEPLDIASLRAVAEYENWSHESADGLEPVVNWFWTSFERASPADQRKLLLFITGSDRIPAMGAAMLRVKISCLGDDCGRYPIARTCFNVLALWRYRSREKLESMLWRAVFESEGFGLK